MEPGKISERQLAFLMLTVTISTVIFFMPQIAARAVEQDAWLTSVIATVWGLIVAVVIVALARRFPGQTFIEYLPSILGRPLGKLVGLLYAFWFLSVGAFIIREFGMFLNITIMPQTPVMVFVVTITTLAFYAVRSGLETWARVNEILLPLILLGVLMVIFLPFEHMDLRRLLPVGVHPLGTMLVSSFTSASWRGEVVLAGMFIPALVSTCHTSRNLALVVIIIGVILAAVEMAVVAVFGGVDAGQLELPVFSLARMISLARIIDRLEAIIVIMWVLGNFIKVCAFLYCSVVATAQVLGFREFQFLVLPVTVLVIALADNVLEDVAEFTDFLSNVWAGYSLLSFEMIVPLLLYLLVLVRPAEKRGAA